MIEIFVKIKTWNFKICWQENWKLEEAYIEHTYKENDIIIYIVKSKIMKILIFAGILFFAIACGSGENSNTPENNENNNTPNKGNSAGSNIIEMDTMHMDTSIQEPTDRRQ